LGARRSDCKRATSVPARLRRWSRCHVSVLGPAEMGFHSAVTDQLCLLHNRPDASSSHHLVSSQEVTLRSHPHLSHRPADSPCERQNAKVQRLECPPVFPLNNPGSPQITSISPVMLWSGAAPLLCTVMRLGFIIERPASGRNRTTKHSQRHAAADIFPKCLS